MNKNTNIWTRILLTTFSTIAIALCQNPRYQADLELKSRLSAIEVAEKANNFSEAEKQYQILLKAPLTKGNPVIRLNYAKLLNKEGNLRAAMNIVQPLVFDQGNYEAVVLYKEDLERTEGKEAVKALHNRIRNIRINGLSIGDYNKYGLNDEQALIFIKGRSLQGRHYFAEAERVYREILPQYPPSQLFFYSLAGAIAAQHRKKEVIPLYEQWYLHSNLRTKTFIKKWFNLDFKKLDSMNRP